MSANSLLAAMRALRALSAREMALVWAALNPADVVATRAALVEVVPEIVTKYGDMAATAAADLYDEWREAAGPRQVYQAIAAEARARGNLEVAARWASAPLYSDRADRDAGVAARLAQILDRNVSNQARETIAENVVRDPAKPRWARIPVGPQSCEWCLMLGSRGFAPGYGYKSEVTAAAASHADCDCQIVPEWAGGPLVERYDPDAVYDQWQAAKAARETSQP